MATWGTWNTYTEYEAKITFHTNMSVYNIIVLLHIKTRWPVLLYAVKSVEGYFQLMGSPLRKCRTNSQRKSQQILNVLYGFYLRWIFINNTMKQLNNHKYMWPKINSPRCAEDRACFRNVFDMHLKCMQIHSICALLFLYSSQRYKLIMK